MYGERNAKIAQLRQSGKTYSEIGQMYGLTKQRVAQIVRLYNGGAFSRWRWPNLKKWMVRHDCRLSDLAEHLGVVPQTVSGWLNGNHEPPLSFAAKVIKLTGMTFEEAFAERSEEDDH